MSNPYINYYAVQSGSGLPSFEGIRYQRGKGWFSNLFLPIMRQILPVLGRSVLPSGIGLAEDLLAGQNVKDSAKSRLKEVGKSLASNTMDFIQSKIQSGSGRKGKRRKRLSIKKTKVLRERKRRKSYKKRPRKSRLPHFLQ
jgi:hypothetical protein